MIKIIKKNIKNKPFFYLSTQVNVGLNYQKIQVYIGKNIPNDLCSFYEKLRQKEIKLVKNSIKNLYVLDGEIPLEEYQKIETLKIKFKYAFLDIPEYKIEKFWREFAIMFIFESNAIEGSKLSQKEVAAIIKKQYIKKSIDQKEIIEVHNSIKAFKLIRSNNFKLNQLSIINLHKLVTQGLDIPTGYKKQKIIVNNKETVAPKDVRKSMSNLINWWQKQKKEKQHPFILAIKFHAKFEYIHPFSDGNGRVGRLLFIWMLLQSNYGIILFKNNNRQSYFSALDKADEGRFKKLYWHCIRTYKQTLNMALKLIK